MFTKIFYNFNEYNYVHFPPKQEFNPENGVIDSFKRVKLKGLIFSSEIYLFNGIVLSSQKDIILYLLMFSLITRLLMYNFLIKNNNVNYLSLSE